MVKATAQSSVTNGSRLLEGIDGRSQAARRFRDLAHAFANDLGGEAALSEVEKALVRQAAALTVRCEAMQSSIVRGEVIDGDILVRLTNSTTRVLLALGLKKRKS